MTQLPEKLEYNRSQTPIYYTTINQLIDYLAEREQPVDRERPTGMQKEKVDDLVYRPINHSYEKLYTREEVIDIISGAKPVYMDDYDVILMNAYKNNIIRKLNEQP